MRASTRPTTPLQRSFARTAKNLRESVCLVRQCVRMEPVSSWLGAHNHTGKPHGSLDHPCAANGLYGTFLVMCGVVAAVMLTGRLCARFAVARYRAKHREWTDEKAREKYGHFWFTRLEAAGLLLLTVSPSTEIIEFFRHKQEASIFWIMSSVTDILGMCGICLAFLWEDTPFEIPFGVLGATVLLLSDALGAYAASLLGLSESEQLGVVVLWFASSCISMAGCVSLALCYFRYPCGPRLKMYFEMMCLVLFVRVSASSFSLRVCVRVPRWTGRGYYVV